MSEEESTLAAARRAFEAGDFQEVRRLATPLTEHGNADYAREALSLLTKISPEPAQYVVLGLSLLFFVIITWRYAFS
jgi:hypothetical protein